MFRRSYCCRQPSPAEPKLSAEPKHLALRSKPKHGRRTPVSWTPLCINCLCFVRKHGLLALSLWRLFYSPDVSYILCCDQCAFLAFTKIRLGLKHVSFLAKKPSSACCQVLFSQLYLKVQCTRAKEAK